MEFLINFLAVAEKVGLLFLIIMIGFVCQRKGMLTEAANKGIGDLVMYIVTPCVIIYAFSATLYERAELLRTLKNIGLVALIAVVVHVAMILAVCAVFRFSDEKRRAVMRFATVFSNAGFFALPLAQALIDTPTTREGSLYAAVYLAVFNIVLWTWGYANMSGDKKATQIRQILLNPGIIGVTVGMLIFVSPLYLPATGGLHLPGVLKDALSAMSALNLPLPMLMVGYYLGKADLLATFKDKWSCLCIGLRLVVFPMITLAILWLLGVRGNVLIVSTISASAPVGATTTILSAKFGLDAELSVRLVSLSTILAILTMPLIVGLAQMLA